MKSLFNNFNLKTIYRLKFIKTALHTPESTMYGTARLSLACFLILVTISEVMLRNSTPRPNVSKTMSVCGESLNQVLKLVCDGVYRRRRSISSPSDFGLMEPNSLASSASFSLESDEIDELIALFGEDLPVEDYAPLAFLLRENALYFPDSDIPIGFGPGAHSNGGMMYESRGYESARPSGGSGYYGGALPFAALSTGNSPYYGGALSTGGFQRYLRLRRNNKNFQSGIHHECCLRKCTYATLRTYCGESRPRTGKAA
ncbi:hypothetical protein M8J75_004781 [Diaphorina citri]|nr:hypothetical protein M8J75_004781 [Diaphorina citri]